MFLNQINSDVKPPLFKDTRKYVSVMFGIFKNLHS